jgi:uncharacterized protein (DUF427 family)
MTNPAPGYSKYPNHQVATRPAAGRVQVRYKGELLADSANAIEMSETHEGSVVAPVLYYVPRKDVRMERLVRSSHRTHCPFKGDASYYSVKDGPENAVWSYEQPYDELPAIKELLSFYPDKFEISAG